MGNMSCSCFPNDYHKDPRSIIVDLSQDNISHFSTNPTPDDRQIKKGNKKTSSSSNLTNIKNSNQPYFK